MVEKRRSIAWKTRVVKGTDDHHILRLRRRAHLRMQRPHVLHMHLLRHDVQHGGVAMTKREAIAAAQAEHQGINMKHPKAYLGDGVYAEMDEYGMLRLTTENGIRVSNEIFIEPEVWNAMVGYMQRVNTSRALHEPHCQFLADRESGLCNCGAK